MKGGTLIVEQLQLFSHIKRSNYKKKKKKKISLLLNDLYVMLIFETRLWAA